MIEIYLLCQTHAYLDRATLSSDKDFYGFQSCQNEGRVASGFAIEIFVMYFAINQDALQSMRYDPFKSRNILNQSGDIHKTSSHFHYSQQRTDRTLKCFTNSVDFNSAIRAGRNLPFLQ